MSDHHSVNIFATNNCEIIGCVGSKDKFGFVESITIDVAGHVLVADRGERLIKGYQLQAGDRTADKESRDPILAEHLISGSK